MYLLVEDRGSRLWRFKYRLAGREKVYAIGAYPEVSLAEARGRLAQARGWIRDGKDPVSERRLQNATTGARQGTTFRAIAEEWLARQKYSDAHRAAQASRQRATS